MLYVADVAEGLVRQVRLPERGAWARTLSADGREAWVACERLYRVSLDDLTSRPVLDRRVVSLATRAGGGCYAGTPEGTVLWLSADGRVEREVDLASGVTLSEKDEQLLASFRKAPLVASPTLLPHTVPATIPLAEEYHLDFMIRGDLVEPRGDGIQPVQVAVRIPQKGRYRFTLRLATPRDHADKMGTFRINPAGSNGPMTAPLRGDRWTQVAEADLDAGPTLFTLMPTGWQESPLMRTLVVERVEGK